MRLSYMLLLSVFVVAAPGDSFGGDWRDDEWQRNAILALIKTKQTPGVIRHPDDFCHRCNFFAAQYGTLRDVPLFRDIKFQVNFSPDAAKRRYKPEDRVGGTNKDFTANQIHEYLLKATENPASGFLRIDRLEGRPLSTPQEVWSQVQKLSDAGRVVFGLKANPSGPGHIVVGVPSIMRTDPILTGGEGPFIRDAQHPEFSVRASMAGSVNDWDLDGVIWVVWAHGDQHTLTLGSGKDPIKVERKPLSSPPPSEPPRDTGRREGLTLLHLLEHRFSAAPPPPPGGVGGLVPLPQIDASGSTESTKTDPRGGIRVEIPIDDDDLDQR